MLKHNYKQCSFPIEQFQPYNAAADSCVLKIYLASLPNDERLRQTKFLLAHNIDESSVFVVLFSRSVRAGIRV